jgi:amino acid permease
MKKVSSLFLASVILLSAMPLSADNFYKSCWQIVALTAMYTTYHLYSENQGLKAKLEEAQANQQKPKECILDKDKEIKPKLT